jgi:hypothetical protein
MPATITNKYLQAFFVELPGGGPGVEPGLHQIISNGHAI